MKNTDIQIFLSLQKISDTTNQSSFAYLVFKVIFTKFGCVVMMGIIFIYILNAISSNIFKQIDIMKCTVYFIPSTFTCKIKTEKNTASLFLLKCQKELFLTLKIPPSMLQSLTHLADIGDQATAVSYDSPTPC